VSGEDQAEELAGHRALPESGEDQAGELAGHRALIYVGGSVAAVKAGDVITLLRRRGAETRVAMTASATHFITSLSLQSLSGNPVVTDLFREARRRRPGGAAGLSAEGRGAGHGMAHLELSEWAEVQVAVAASANLLARLALGLADDAVTTTALACRAPLVVAPAMETAMWEHPATRGHVETLRARGVTFVGPVAGRLASGHEGMGRMAEPAAIVEVAVAQLEGLRIPAPAIAELPSGLLGSADAVDR
jgi:phosphopantothenoylcysteine decarboxylase/phosphopantothenate--cysteine ligase